jgi:hypothetical protein
LAGFAAAPGARFGSFGAFGGFEGNIRQWPDLEVSEHLEGLKEESGNIGPVAKERLDLSQLIVWQFQEPVWQVSR